MENILPTAIIYCENNFTKVDGKTANGLVRHSKNFRITSVIDSSKKGLDSGFILDNKINQIPIFKNLREAINNEIKIPAERLPIAVAEKTMRSLNPWALNFSCSL